jgi:hypothetical protein
MLELLRRSYESQKAKAPAMTINLTQARFHNVSVQIIKLKTLIECSKDALAKTSASCDGTSGENGHRVMHNDSEDIKCCN